jgi:hypothetical protein
MANKIEAINAYRPRIKRGKIVELNESAYLLEKRTSLYMSSIYATLIELKFLASFILKGGRSLRLPGIGLLSPEISLDGKIIVTLKLDKEIINELNQEVDGFWGEIINKKMIGKTVDELVNIWNEQHPDDPVEK